MSATPDLHADGSSIEDAHRVEIDRSKAPHRWGCPEGHVSWDKTNSHIWCPTCARQAENGRDIDPEHWEILDKMNDETIPYAAVDWQ